MATTATPPAEVKATLTKQEAARLAGLCHKTLDKLSAEGEKMGRFKAGTAVRFHRETFEAWLKQKAASGS